jgi:TolB-like protein
MKRYLFVFVLGLSLVFSGCATLGSYEYRDIDSLIMDASWDTINILYDNYDDLDSAPIRTMAVYYFLEGDKISPMSDTLIEGLTTEIANAVAYENIPVSVVSRTKLDRILDELTFQQSDLVDADAQRSVGKQLGAQLVVTGNISTVERGKKFNIQVIEVETGVVLGGLIMHLIRD